MYDVEDGDGEILIDGKNIKDYNPMWLREQIAVVSQDIQIFSKTLRDNLIFGCQTMPSDEKIDEVFTRSKEIVCMRKLAFCRP